MKRTSWISYFGDLRSGQFCDLPIILQREKNHVPPLRIRTGNFKLNWGILEYWWWSRCKFLSATFIKVIWGQTTSSDVTNRCVLICRYWKELQTWVWSHCACLVKTLRLIRNMPYFGQHVNFTWPWPEVKYWPHRSRSACTAHTWFNTMVPELSRWLSWFKGYSQKRFCPKTILALFAPST